MYSRRRVIQLGGISALIGLAGCTFLPLTGIIGFRLRNYTEEPHEARVKLEFYGQTAFDQTYELPAASGADPYVHVEEEAISNVPKNMTYTATLFLNGKESERIKADMDCTDRKGQIDEEMDINIGFDDKNTVMMADTKC